MAKTPSPPHPNENEVLVFVDIPDVDNVLCCLSVLKANPGRTVNIVLSPRPVDFAAEPYPENFPKVQKMLAATVKDPVDRPRTKEERGRIAMRRRMTPIHATPAWSHLLKPEDTATDEEKAEVEELSRFFKQERWDRVFEGGNNDTNGLKADTRIYMEASAYRFASFLRKRGVLLSSYRLYWDEESMLKIAPGMRHATHVSDYTYGYTRNPAVVGLKNGVPVDSKGEVVNESKDEKVGREQLDRHRIMLRLGMDIESSGHTTEAECAKAEGYETRPRGERRRDCLRRFCIDYIKSEANSWGTQAASFRTRSYDGGNTHTPIITWDYDSLIAEHSSPESCDKDKDHLAVMIGGPFTEAFKWLEKGNFMSSVTAMACFIKGDDNILINQFNIAVDIFSAWQFLERVAGPQGPIRTLLVPTECIKVAPWKLTKEQLLAAFGTHMEVWKAVETFTNESKALASINLFDWVAAIVAREPDILISRPVEISFYQHTETIAPGTDVTICTETKTTVRPVRSCRAPTLILKAEFVSAKAGSHHVRMCTDERGANDEILRRFHETVIAGIRRDLES